MTDSRREDLVRFYSILDELENGIGGARKLGDCRGRMIWPQRWVYFFGEAGETRSDSGEGPRIVRVGTHAMKTGASTWKKTALAMRVPTDWRASTLRWT